MLTRFEKSTEICIKIGGATCDSVQLAILGQAALKMEVDKLSLTRPAMTGSGVDCRVYSVELSNLIELNCANRKRDQALYYNKLRESVMSFCEEVARHVS